MSYSKKNKGYNALKKVSRSILGLILLAGIVLWVGPEKIFSSFQDVNWKWLFVFIPLYSLNFILGSIGMYSVFPPSVNLSQREFFKMYVCTQNMGTFLPFQIGETSLVFFLKKHGVPYASSIVLLTLDKIITLGVLVVAGSISLLIFFGEEIVNLRVGKGWIIGLLLSIFFLGCLLITKYVKPRRLKTPLLQKFYGRLTGILSELSWSLKHNKKGIIINCLTTLIRRSLVESLMKLVIFRALSVYPLFGKLILISNILGLLSLVPITAQGIGVVEIGAIYLFSLTGLESDKTIALYLVARPMAFILSGGFLGIYMIAKTINFRQ